MRTVRATLTGLALFITLACGGAIGPSPQDQEATTPAMSAPLLTPTEAPSQAIEPAPQPASPRPPAPHSAPASPAPAPAITAPAQAPPTETAPVDKPGATVAVTLSEDDGKTLLPSEPASMDKPTSPAPSTAAQRPAPAHVAPSSAPVATVGQLQVNTGAAVHALLDGRFMLWSPTRGFIVETTPGNHTLEIQNMLGRIRANTTVTISPGERELYQYRSSGHVLSRRGTSPASTMPIDAYDPTTVTP